MGSRQVQMAAVFRWVGAEGKSPIFTIYRKSNHKGRRLSLKNSKFLLMTEVKAAIMQYFPWELDKRKVRWQDWDTEPWSFSETVTSLGELSDDHEAMKQILSQDIYYKCHEYIHKVKSV